MPHVDFMKNGPGSHFSDLLFSGLQKRLGFAPVGFIWCGWASGERKLTRSRSLKPAGLSASPAALNFNI
jgi:hypothetical protein